MAVAIKVENLSKQYRLGLVGSGTLRDDVIRWWYTVRGKEDPLLKIGDVNDRTQKGKSDYVWSLKDINFEVEQGDVLGIIGRNGAGKSTLLKILSRVTAPTIGNVKLKGRIASLLEVGTGFHPELTGKENIYLNGAILGMRKHEIKRRFDEIVSFSGVERYIDTPVKRYSSGMYVRLAFGVAAHLESEILIVDEVLAVGDAEFQKKCLGKMGEINKGDGRTILFVSHNMGSLKQLCKNGLLLTNGIITYKGTINDTVSQYMLSAVKNIKDITGKYSKKEIEDKDVQLVEAIMTDNDGNERAEFSINEDIIVRLKILCKNRIPDLYAYITIKNSQQEFVIESDSYDCPPNVLDTMAVGENYYSIKINRNILPIGEFSFYINFTSRFVHQFDVESPRDILKFSVQDTETRRGAKRKAQTSQLLKWKIYDVNQ